MGKVDGWMYEWMCGQVDGWVRWMDRWVGG